MNSVLPHFEVQMWTGRRARVPQPTDDITPVDPLAQGHAVAAQSGRLEMCIERLPATAMVQNDEMAVPVGIPADRGDHAISDSLHRRAELSCDIDAPVRTHGGRAASVVRGHAPNHRPQPSPGESPRR